MNGPVVVARSTLTPNGVSSKGSSGSYNFKVPSFRPKSGSCRCSPIVFLVSHTC